MPLLLKFSNSPEALADQLAANDLGEAGPFQKEFIVVASTGLRKWLALKLADKRGICANTEFPTPHTFIQLLLKAVLDKEEDPAFSKEAMTWRIYKILKAGEGIRELKIPVDYITGKPDLATLQLAQRVADLFDQYLTYRPDWILAWDKDQGIKNSPPSARNHETWQKHLWQQLNAKHLNHRAGLYDELIEKLQEQPVASFPEKISVFGTHTLPPVFLEVLKSLGEQHDVTLYLTQPTPDFWGDHPLKKGSTKRFKTETFPDGDDDKRGNPLIAALGGQGRDLFNVLIDAGISTTEADDTALFHDPDATSILGSLQHSVYEIGETTPGNRLDPAKDASLRVHCCHHPLREVEVLHDTLLKLFSDDPSLTPNDVLVLAPDIEEYAPLIDAVFGAPEEGIPEILYSIADRSFRSSSRVVESFYQILDFIQSRFKAVDFYALLQTPAFRARFGWDDQDIALIRKWISGTGVAWGQDAAHRASFDLPEYSDYSFEEMFRKVFLGYALGKDAGVADIYHSVEGQDSLLIGRIAEAYELLSLAAKELNKPLPASDWARKLESCVVAPFLDDFRRGGTEVRQIRNGLEKLAMASENITTPVDLKAMTTFLEGIIEDGIPARGFMSRGVTFGRLTPMRAIPHKVVCLLGMQEGAFPRDPRPHGFDLMKADGLVRTGDRAANQSDRYLLLETILSAKTHLHISYSGFSPRNDSVSPPATPVGELLDFLHQTWPKSDDKSSKLKSPFITEHRLHGHHPDYFAVKSISGFLSYSQTKFAAAKAALETKETISIDAIKTDEDPPDSPLYLEDFIRFFIDPAKDFCKNQLKISIPYDEEAIEGDEPLEFNNLDRYKIFDSVINREVFGKEEDIDLKLPPGEYGRWLKATVENEAREKADQLKENFADELAPAPTEVEVDIRLETDSMCRRLTGMVAGIYGPKLIRFRAADKLKAKDRIRVWILHLALNASGLSKDALLINKGLAPLAFPAMEKETALSHLNTLFNYYQKARSEPLPFEVACSEAWVNGDNTKDSMSKAQSEWAPHNGYNPPSANLWMFLCWRSNVPFEAPHTEAFAECAEAIFGPLRENTQ